METTLAEVLRCREERVLEQRRLLEGYGRPLISFTVNMPGPVKLCPESRYIHERGVAAVRAALAGAGIAVPYCAARETPAGLEAFFVADAPAPAVKELTCAIEEGTPLGRLYDLDVLELVTGAALTREGAGRPRRSCLLCGEEAPVCARSRRHSVEELTRRIGELVAADREMQGETEGAR